MSAGSLAPISQLRMGNGGAGRGLGSLAPLGSLPSMTLGSGISSNPLGGGLNKPKLGGLKTSATNPSQPLSRSSSSSSTSSSTSSSPRNHNHGSNPTSPSSSSSSSRVQPLKFAVRYNPPTIALEYRDLRTSAHKNRMKVFELSKIFLDGELQIDTSSLTSRTPIERLSARLSSKFPEYLSPDMVTQQQLQRIVKKSLSRPNNTAKHGAAATISDSYNNSHSTTTTSTTAARSSSHNQRIHSISSQIHSSTSSASSSYIDEEFEHSRGSDHYDSKSPVKKAATTTTTTAATVKPKAVVAAPAAAAAATHDFFFPADEDADDFNRASEAELRAKKAEMNVAFEKNMIKPTDAGYVYDKQVEFEEATEESGWD